MTLDDCRLPLDRAKGEGSRRKVPLAAISAGGANACPASSIDRHAKISTSEL
jgi:hypothetical protein